MVRLLDLVNPLYVSRRRDRIRPYLQRQIRDRRSALGTFTAIHGLPILANERKLAALKGKHLGRVAFLIGNGPSVRIPDLERLEDEVTFCCNRFYLAYEKMAFRPTYTICADRQMIEDFGAEIVARSESVTFLVSERPPGISGDYIWLRFKHSEPMVFSQQIYDHVMTGGGTLIAAMQLGYFMGLTRFLLYGVDHDFEFAKDSQAKANLRSASGDGNHFIENYRSGKPWTPPVTELIEESFQICDRLLRSRGGWVKNATRGGKLEVLERIDFDEVVAI